jgi:hypothetical protein
VPPAFCSPAGASFAPSAGLPAFATAAFTASSIELPCGLPIHATLPSPPTTNAHGMPLRFAAIIHSLAIVASPSKATRYPIASPFLATKSRTFFSFDAASPPRSKPATLMSVTSGCDFCISVRCGILAMHGPHQVAQNSTT